VRGAPAELISARKSRIVYCRLQSEKFVLRPAAQQEALSPREQQGCASWSRQKQQKVATLLSWKCIPCRSYRKTMMASWRASNVAN